MMEFICHNPQDLNILIFPDMYVNLKKAIYGLKHAPRAWYTELREFLKSFGFSHTQSDQSLFVHSRNGIILYM